MSRYPDKGMPWWRPDGQTMTDPPLDGSDHDIRGSHDKANANESNWSCGLAARRAAPATRPGCRATATTWASCGRAGEGRPAKPLDEMQVIAVRVPVGLSAVDLRLWLAAGKWKTVRTIDGQPAAGTRQFSTKKKDDGSLVITLRPEPSDSARHQQRVVVIDAKGQTRAGSLLDTRTVAGGAESDWLFRDVSDEPGQIRSVEIQSRPYEPVSLRSISMQPGIKTDPKLIAEPLGADGSERLDFKTLRPEDIGRRLRVGTNWPVIPQIYSTSPRGFVTRDMGQAVFEGFLKELQADQLILVASRDLLAKRPPGHVGRGEGEHSQRGDSIHRGNWEEAVNIGGRDVDPARLGNTHPLQGIETLERSASTGRHRRSPRPCESAIGLDCRQLSRKSWNRSRSECRRKKLIRF